MTDLVLTHDGIENHYFRLFFEEWKYNRVVSRVSGGLDSALSLYLCAKFASDLNYDLELNVFTAVDVFWDETFGNTAETSKNVVKFVKDKFPSVKINHKLFPFTRNENHSPKIIKWGKHPNSFKGKNYYIVPMLEQYIKETNSQIAVHSVTKNIPLEVTEVYSDFENYPGTDRTQKTLRYYKNCGPAPKNRYSPEGILDSNTYKQMKVEEMPWYSVDKTFVAAMYRKFDLMDSLYPLTESCVFSPASTNIDSDLEGTPCRACYWCNERYYAFGSYDYALQ